MGAGYEYTREPPGGSRGVMGGLKKINRHKCEVVQIEFETQPRRNRNGSVILNYNIVKTLRELGVDQHRLFVQINF